jgi:hypothetical protein
MPGIGARRVLAAPAEQILEVSMDVPEVRFRRAWLP